MSGRPSKLSQFWQKVKRPRTLRLIIDFDDYLIYVFLRLPGAFILWLVSGFKYKIGNIAREKGENTREWILSILFYASIIGTLVILNN